MSLRRQANLAESALLTALEQHPALHGVIGEVESPDGELPPPRGAPDTRARATPDG